MRVKDYSGRTIGSVSIVAKTDQSEGGKRLYLCRCVCEREFYRDSGTIAAQVKRGRWVCEECNIKRMLGRRPNWTWADLNRRNAAARKAANAS